MLAIRCQFLNGTYQAAAPGAVAEPEWPPHPARLHSALVAAGWAATGEDEFPLAGSAALKWLERLPPPALCVPAGVVARRSGDVYVPRNLSRAESGDVLSRMRRGEDATRQQGRVARRFPTSVPGDEPVWFIWNSAAGEHAPALGRLVSEIQYLGSSRSPVCCDLVGSPPAPTMIPVAREGIRALRVVDAGATDMLLANRYAYPPPVTGAMVGYRPVTATAPEAMKAAGPFDDLVILGLERRFPLTVLHAALVAKAFREAVLAKAGDDAPAILHGHGRHPHVAFLALANAGHPHADGRIMGIAVAIPRDATPAERVAINRAVTAVTALRQPELRRPWTVSATPEMTLRTLSPETWLGPARRWQTVTPAILDRYPKRRTAEGLEQAVRISLEHAGLTPPSRLSVSPFPWLSAALPAGAYGRQGLPAGLRVHIELEFSAPTRGPVMVGRGRYFGVGLLKPVSDGGAEA